jgi:AcrR family transcriptional regulator
VKARGIDQSGGRAAVVEREAPLRELLLWGAVDVVAQDGLERLSLRTTAAKAGATTAAIVHHFKNKSGLLDAVSHLAYAAELEFHDSVNVIALTQKLSHQALVEWVAWYITTRANNRIALFWSELLFKATTVDGSPESIAAWHDLRCKFWGKLLSVQGIDTSMAPFFVAYLCMEEVCAQGLSGQVEYELLMRESVWTLIAAGLGSPTLIERSVSSIFDAQRRAFVVPVEKDRDTAADRLLNFASKNLLRRGIHSINQRKIGEDAGTSASMVIYYFGSMAAFESQAIWRAMVQGGVPPSISPSSDPELTNTLDKWSAVLAKTICATDGDREPGFYCNFARIAGEVSLLSRRRPEMKSLIEHLRMLDGSASFTAGQTIWRDALTLSRNQASAFAMWMKGHAVLSNVLQYSLSDLENDLKAMVTKIVKVDNA